MTAGASGRDDGRNRPLTALECQVIGAILVDGCPGVNELRAQLAVARVSGAWAEGGSPSIDLEVPSGAPAAPVHEAVLPVDAHVYSEAGEYLGELMVWLASGKIAALEYAWVTDAMPMSLPDVKMLRVSVKNEP